MRFKFLFLFVSLLAIFSLLLVRLIDVELFHGADFFAKAQANRYFVKKNTVLFYGFLTFL